LDFGKLDYIRLYKEAAQQVLFIHAGHHVLGRGTKRLRTEGGITHMETQHLFELN